MKHEWDRRSVSENVTRKTEQNMSGYYMYVHVTQPKNTVLKFNDCGTGTGTTTAVLNNNILIITYFYHIIIIIDYYDYYQHQRLLSLKTIFV